jgi:hypothetical protein
MKDKFKTLVDYIEGDRKKHKEIWYVGIPEIEPITLSLRGFLDKKSLLWEAVESEKASCCQSYLPGEDWLEHCSTRDHIETMVKENHDLNKQVEYMKKIILIDLTLEDD